MTDAPRSVAVCLVLIVVLFASIAVADDFKTIDGKEYKNATVSHVEPDGIVLTSKSGISKVYFVELPNEVQQRFHYDPAQAAQFTAATQNGISEQNEEIAAQQQAVAAEQRQKAEIQRQADEQQRRAIERQEQIAAQQQQRQLRAQQKYAAQGNTRRGANASPGKPRNRSYRGEDTAKRRIEDENIRNFNEAQIKKHEFEQEQQRHAEDLRRAQHNSQNDLENARREREYLRSVPDSSPNARRQREYLRSVPDSSHP